MVEVFKSPINLQRAADMKIAAISAPIVIDANSSVRAVVPFARPFTEAPFVHYNIICTDNAFELSHYITEIRVDGFTICIENQALVARSIKVMFEAKAN